MPLSRTRCPAARNVLGCLLHTWTCCACGRTSRGKELFSGLSLQLPNGAASVTLQVSLRTEVCLLELRTSTIGSGAYEMEVARRFRDTPV